MLKSWFNNNFCAGSEYEPDPICFDEGGPLGGLKVLDRLVG